MKSRLPSIIGIVLTTIFLLLVNHFSEATFVKDYALAFIITGMLGGVLVSKYYLKSKAAKKKQEDSSAAKEEN